jgi:O-antigen/teichoic acid export membrane protein
VTHSEARRGLSRIVTNYARLMVSIAAGIALIPVLIAWLGDEPLGLFLFVGAQVGLAGMFQDVMRHSLVREVGSAWHAGEKQFASAYNGAFLVCIGIAAISTAVYGVLVLVTPLFNIDPSLVGAARWMIAAEGGFTALLVIASPTLNMYVVREKFIAHNLWTACMRTSYLASALIFWLLIPTEDTASGLVRFTVCAVGLNALSTLVAILVPMRDARLRPSPRLATRSAARQVLGTFGWNSGIILAMNLHERVAQFIMNLAFGLFGNAVFGVALRLVSYVRMVTLGMTFGLDAVSTRLAADDDRHGLAIMVRSATRLHACIALPASIGIFILAEPILELWLGRALEDPERVIPPATVLVRIMAAALASRAVADGWMKVLYGAGHIRRYAPIVLLGGIANPVLAILLIKILPETDVPLWRSAITGTAWALGITMVAVNVGFMPMKTAQLLGIRRRETVQPLIPPFLIALACAPIAAAPILWPERLLRGGAWTIDQLVIVIALDAAAYLGLAFFFLLTPDERTRALGFARRTFRLGHGG